MGNRGETRPSVKGTYRRIGAKACGRDAAGVELRWLTFSIAPARRYASSKSPSRDLALLLADKLVPDFTMFWLVTIILELGHLTADVDQGVQLR